MLRGHFRPDAQAGERFFRWRGGDVSRLEGLADAIFALALTLLVVRLEVPATSTEVKLALLRAPVYVVCFALFLWIWHAHHQFHRRYGLEDPLTLTIDGAILFTVLLFALPLRFTADLLYDGLFFGGTPVVRTPEGAPVLDGAGETLPKFLPGDGELLMTFYAGGFGLIFGLLALQTWNARRQADLLELDELERLVTAQTLRTHLASAAIGAVALLMTLSGGVPGWMAGSLFWLLGPMHGGLGWFHGRQATRKAVELGVE